MAQTRRLIPGRIAKKIAPLLWRRQSSGSLNDFLDRWEVSYDDAVKAGAGDTDLGQAFLDHRGRSIHKWTQYLPAYDEQFARYRHGFPQADGTVRPLRMLEIGVQHGGSLQLWREYFGPDAVIFGIDVDPNCAAVDDPDLEVRIGSQDDPQFLRKVVAEMGGVDIVLDDGSHMASHQRVSFQTLFPLLADGGVYAVEDLHSSYWPQFGGGYQRSGFLETAKQLVDDMHAWYHQKGERLPVKACRSVPKVTFYDSLVFVQKQRHAPPSVVQFGKKSF